jgi:hypothetical protein
VTVAPPLQDTWWVPADVLADVLATLRLSSGDVDESRLEALIPAAAAMINAYLDRPTGDGLAPWEEAIAVPALEQVTIELYRTKDTAAGSPSDYSAAALMSRWAAVDPLGNVRSHLQPLKRRWGLA